MSERAAVKLIVRHKRTGNTREVEVPFGGTFSLDRHEDVDWQATQGHYWRRVDDLERQLTEAQGELTDGMGKALEVELGLRAEIARIQGKLGAVEGELTALGLDLSGDFDSVDDVIDVVGEHERALARILKEGE